MAECKKTPRIATKSAKMTACMHNRSVDHLYAMGLKKQRDRNLAPKKS